MKHAEYKKRRQQDAHDFFLKFLNQCPEMSRIFSVTLEWCVQCNRCRKKSFTEENTTHISLPLATSENGQDVLLEENMQRLCIGRIGVLDLLSRFSQPSMLIGGDQYECEECRSKQDAKQTVRIAKANQVLVLHLERYTSDIGKVSSKICVPQSLEVAEKEYKLRACVEHQGSTLHCGHYIAKLLLPDGSFWSASDCSVNVCRDADGFEDAYLLFYEAIH
jgi:ubiquitin C-terminal hydrolase